MLTAAVRTYWLDIADRVVATAAQALAASLPVLGTIPSVHGLPWRAALTTAAVAGLFALVKAIAVGGLTGDRSGGVASPVQTITSTVADYPGAHRIDRPHGVR